MSMKTRQRRHAALVTIMVLVGGLATTVSADSDYVQGQLLIRFDDRQNWQPGTLSQTNQDILDALGGSVVRQYWTPGLCLIDIPGTPY